jgi:4-hydroxyphenylpyruvate dioxygenase-like putative hemolysin
MKKPTKRMWRQGDVLVIEGAPSRPVAKEVPREKGAVVLAHGEVTGHMHAIEAPGAQLLALEGNRITGEQAAQAIARLGGGVIPDRALQLKQPSDLKHDEHSTIKLPSGSHTVRIQREYSPQALRSVAD